MQDCFTTTGGVQPDNNISPGCGAIFQKIESCYDSLGPWMNPYNSAQSAKFQSCLCGTSNTNPFTPESALWRNFTGRSDCLLPCVDLRMGELSKELQRMENFCAAQEPNAYLFRLRLEGWLFAIAGGASLSQPALTGSVAQITTSLGPS
jgi:hypothetical protein